MCDNYLGNLAQGTVLIFRDYTSHAVGKWKAVAVIDGMEYYGEGENAVTALRRALAKVEGLVVKLASD